METTFADILRSLSLYRKRDDFRSDAEREEARLDAVEWALTAALKKLRDEHDK